MTMYAIFTYDLAHPIKSWERLRSVQIHNARTKPIAHGVDGTLPPKILIGSEDIVGDARRHFVAHNMDPDRLPEGTNIAVEAVMSATPEFFLSGTAEEREKRLEAWEQAQVGYANRRFGQHMVLSMVMHYDEEAPHAHLLLAPLKLAPDKRRSDQTPNWRFDSDQLWKRAKLRDQQTDYANAMARFGLSRGVEGSDNKHEPYANVMARVEADRAALALQAREVELREQEANDLLTKVLARETDANRRQRQADEQHAEATTLKARLVSEAVDHDDLVRRSNEVDRQSALLATLVANADEQRSQLSGWLDEVEVGRNGLDRAYAELAADALSRTQQQQTLNQAAACLAADRREFDQATRRAKQMDNGALLRRAHLLTQLEGASRHREEAARAMARLHLLGARCWA